MFRLEGFTDHSEREAQILGATHLKEKSDSILKNATLPRANSVADQYYIIMSLHPLQ